MNYRYLTEDSPEVFEASSTAISKVLLNPYKLKFMQLAHPTLDELRVAIKQYALKRLEDRWNELMQPSLQGAQLEAFKPFQKKLACVAQDRVQALMGEPQYQPFFKRIQAMSMDEQREFAQPLKPKNISEMLAFYRDSRANDQTGYRFLNKVLDSATSGADFFGKLTDYLFSGVAESDYTLGQPKLGFHQPRIFEFLSLSLNRRWLLFPFITGESGTNEIRALMHGFNAQRYLNPIYCPPEIAQIAEAMKGLKEAKSTYAVSAKYGQYLLMSSTYRTIAQSSVQLFRRCLELVDNDTDTAYRQVGYARRAYNTLIKLHNSHFPTAQKQPPLAKPKTEVTLDEFSSFEYLVHLKSDFRNWADRLSAFVRSNSNTPAAGQVRKTACNDFCEFLLTLSDAPQRPEQVSRSLINDYTDKGPCYRNFLRNKYIRAESCNSKLGELSSFFTFVQERIRVEHTGDLQNTLWFNNPVDLGFDRMATPYRAGTTRKAIGSEILEEMRNILSADDYAWSKQWRYDWAHLVNTDTNALEHVWCPSSVICLYLMLSIPLRGIQARMLDSGEGDGYIFDFDTRTMVPNPNQLAVENKVDARRKEGFIQIMASGLITDPELIGMWIPINKTSDEGYPVPWISEDLLKHLKYQCDWIHRYAHHPNTQSIQDAQGHRNTPKEWHGKEKRFFCLFRDPAAERTSDQSLPVSKQKLLKLWGRLCLETQRRMNARGAGASQRVQLVKAGTEDNPYPSAIHDLHTLRVSGITDLLDRGVPLNIVMEYIAGHATYMMTLWYDKPIPGMVRQQLLRAEKIAGDSRGPLPRFSESEIQNMKHFLLSNPTFEGLYTGFDALEENVGLVQVRQSGICPGTRCEEGGLSDTSRMMPVPVGDRGPSCPQCRFWLTGPAFLLGQTIEGNQLILKIRQKVAALAKVREKIMNAEDAGDTNLADLLRGQADVEERQLNDMLTEWWHRMQFYESSITKLEDYRRALDTSVDSKNDQSIVLLKNFSRDETKYGYSTATEIELKHFLSTCAELLPSYTSESISAHQDIELAIGKFLAMNDEKELTSIFFKLSDEQRLTAANLTIELMMRASNSPLQTSDLLEGKAQLRDVPQLQREISQLLVKGHVISVVEEKTLLKVTAHK
jgi:hypothetical protein